ncbi:endonuclease/exonuclease/phosphatase family protein [Pelomonas sp. SE-A7]|uniref:endonuclease/exonuclease/phosphatase family protein n=1 Tax=Pelomonas sp. SE-A7 TaxID=3054953 RepID=UPI00259CC5D0|nr:endonuclease/exonuclease/phosphatase family protein [Pelomonas sp. SE-A7]MDM4766223.1 endonuclease/exonuclease/phosphatase family protein [Pelomonas sp. SE-A7]
MKYPLALILAAATASSSTASAQPLRVASWNLGWHVSTAELPAWIAQCSKPYAKSAADGVWRVAPEGAAGATVGWFIKESRSQLEGLDLSRMPPCGVYEGPDRSKLAVTPAAWAERNQRIAQILDKDVRADVIAFQEVSGTAAVREALGAAAERYNVCSFDGRFKVQRLAFAWRKELGAGDCRTEDAMTLPEVADKDQVRPGFVLTLKIADKRTSFMTVHLKSSCVSPLDGRGRLDQDRSNKDRGFTDPCPTLQQQVAPIEAAVEKLAATSDQFIVLGDFNRNLWHEANEVEGAKALRSDGSTDLAKPLPAGVKTQNLFKEVFDGEPANTRAALVPMECKLDPKLAALCDRSKTEALRREDMAPLGEASGLGCRNAIGLDHFVVADKLKAKVLGAQKVGIGAFGDSLPPPAGKSDPVLGASDHCPIVMSIDLR